MTTLYPQTNAIFSPDDKYVVTGIGATSKDGRGKLLFMSKDSLEVVKELVVDSSPVKVVWHPKINQVSWKTISSRLWGSFSFRSIGTRSTPWRSIHPFGFWRADLGFFCLYIRCAIIKIVTGLSNGQICVLYSPTSSLNGAKLPLSKGPPRKVTIEDMSDALAQPAIITPHALPMFREGEIARGMGKRKREKERLDPRKSRRPELPVTGPGKGGRVGASATQHIVQNLVKDTTREEDVRGRSFLYSLLLGDQLIITSPLAPLVRAVAPSIGPHSLALAVFFPCRVFCLPCCPW